VPVLILVVLAVVWFLPGYKSWQLKRAYDKIEKPYYADTYGGATPEETYDMFIEALKDGDVELASKYFILEKQDNWQETFEKFQSSDSLEEFIFELENTKKIWKKSEKSDDTAASFTYPNVVEEDKIVEFEGQKLTIPAGNYTNEVMFIKYPSEVWKIEGL